MMRKKLHLSPLDRQGSFPFYTIAPVAGTILCNMLTYYGSRLITRGLPHWDLTLPLDRWIPFVPSAVSIYVLAFLSWVVGIWVIARESPAVCYEVLAGEQIAKLLCLALGSVWKYSETTLPSVSTVVSFTPSVPWRYSSKAASKPLWPT